MTGLYGIFNRRYGMSQGCPKAEAPAPGPHQVMPGCRHLAFNLLVQEGIQDHDPELPLHWQVERTDLIPDSKIEFLAMQMWLARRLDRVYGREPTK